MNRPVNLDLRTIRFPITAIISILHRVTGIVLFLSVPLLLWILGKSLFTPAGFFMVKALFQLPLIKIGLWLFLLALMLHLVAGIRHLLMDWGIGESLEGGQRTAKISLFVTILLAVLMGVWLW